MDSPPAEVPLESSPTTVPATATPETRRPGPAGPSARGTPGGYRLERHASDHMVVDPAGAVTNDAGRAVRSRGPQRAEERRRRRQPADRGEKRLRTRASTRRRKIMSTRERAARPARTPDRPSVEREQARRGSQPQERAHARADEPGTGPAERTCGSRGTRRPEYWRPRGRRTCSCRCREPGSYGHRFPWRRSNRSSIGTSSRAVGHEPPTGNASCCR